MTEQEPIIGGGVPRPPRLHRLTAWVLVAAAAAAVAIDAYSLLRGKRRPLRTRSGS